jgi:hypothetical protein
MRSRGHPSHRQRRPVSTGRGKLVVVALAVALPALVGGSVWLIWPQNQPAEPTNTPPATPVSTTTAAATPDPIASPSALELEAARATYEGFIATSDAVFASGGTGVERIDALASPEVAAIQRVDFETFRSHAIRMVGESKITVFTIQLDTTPRSPEQVLAAFACVDMTNFEVLNAAGQTAIKDLPSLAVFDLTFDQSSESPTGMVVALNRYRGGAEGC